MAKKLDIKQGNMKAQVEGETPEIITGSSRVKETRSKKFIVAMTPTMHEQIMAIKSMKGESINGKIVEFLEAYIEENRAYVEAYEKARDGLNGA